MNFTSPEALQAYAQALAKQHKKILLTGDLGAGKTTFTGGFVQNRGIEETQVNSPTYTYINTYTGTSGEKILHVDMYRISSYEQCAGLGIFDLIDDHDIIIIERPKRKEEFIDDTWIHIHIEKTSETCRDVSIIYPGKDI